VGGLRWFPTWAERRLPRFGIEGEEFFEELDRKVPEG